MDHFSPASCEELDEISAARGWQTGYQQLGTGELSVQFDLARTPRLVLSDKRGSKEMLWAAATPRGHLAVCMPHSPGNNGTLYGRDLSSGHVGLFVEGDDILYRAPANLRVSVMTLPVDLFTRCVFAGQHGPAGEKAAFETSIRDLGKNAVFGMAHQIRNMMSLIDSSASLEAARISLAELEENLISSLCNAVAESQNQSNPARKRGCMNRRKYVSDAMEYIGAHLEEPLGITTLSEHANTSQRSLTTAFLEMVGITPAKYVRIRRLNAVRGRLSRPEPRDTVTRVALTYGFSHLSHFAREYHSLFFEYPSETLSRSQ